MAEWSAFWARNSAVPGSSPTLPTCHAGFALGRLQFRSSATLVNGQLVASSLRAGSLVRASSGRFFAAPCVRKSNL